MDLQENFADQALEAIVEEAAIYMCACPGQVASEIRSLRELIRYQRNCLESNDNNHVVHATITASALQAHRIMERCLEEVLELEGWDRQTLKMPPGLRRRRDQLVDGDV